MIGDWLANLEIFSLWSCCPHRVRSCNLVASLRYTCAIMMLSNQYPNMAHLWDGMDYLKGEVFTIKDLDRFINIIWENLLFWCGIRHYVVAKPVRCGGDWAKPKSKALYFSIFVPVLNYMVSGSWLLERGPEYKRPKWASSTGWLSNTGWKAHSSGDG